MTPPCQQSYAKSGDRRLVFDSQAWQQAGYDQPDGNAQFWREAEIVSTARSIPYKDDPRAEEVATVRFLHDGRVSRGHFTSMMKAVPRS